MPEQMTGTENVSGPTPAVSARCLQFTGLATNAHLPQ